MAKDCVVDKVFGFFTDPEPQSYEFTKDDETDLQSWTRLQLIRPFIGL